LRILQRVLNSERAPLVVGYTLVIRVSASPSSDRSQPRWRSLCVDDDGHATHIKDTAIA